MDQNGTKIAAELMRRELKLNHDIGTDCHLCGQWIGSWGIKEDSIDYCAKLIVAALSAG